MVITVNAFKSACVQGRLIFTCTIHCVHSFRNVVTLSYAHSSFKFVNTRALSSAASSPYAKK